MTYYEPDEKKIERERVILQEIRKRNNLHHNALLKTVVPEFMAKTTFEKTKNSLVERKVISVIQKGNKKFYSITQNYEIRSLQQIERVSHESFQNLQHEIRRSKEDFQHKDITEKISKSVQILKGLLQTDNAFTVLDSIKNPKKTLYKDEHLEIQEMISKIFQVIQNDKDFELTYPNIMSYLEKNFS